MPGEGFLVSGRQISLDDKQRGETLSSATFQITNGFGTALFSELGGISSELEQAEYMEAGPNGNPVFGRFLGKAKPPVVSLKRAMGGGPDTKWVWQWHAQARLASAAAYSTTELHLIPAGSSSAQRVYTLYHAIPTKVELAGMKAGGTEVVIQTLTMQCDEIVEL